MNDVWLNKGALVASIEQHPKKARAANIIGYLIISSMVAMEVFMFVVFYTIYEGDIPFTFLAFLVMYIPMEVFAYYFFMAAIGYRKIPIMVYTNGLDFHTNKLGHLIHLPGFVTKEDIKEVRFKVNNGQGGIHELAIITRKGITKIISARDEIQMKKMTDSLRETYHIEIIAVPSLLR